MRIVCYSHELKSISYNDMKGAQINVDENFVIRIGSHLSSFQHQADCRTQAYYKNKATINDITANKRLKIATRSMEASWCAHARP